MQSKAIDVDTYLQEVPQDRLAALRQIRQLCLEHLTGFEEGMTYGMPGYSRNDVVEVAFASQKNNIALYILRTDVLNRHRSAFPKSAIGKGCIRYANPEKIDFELVRQMLVETASSMGQVC